MTAGQMLLAGFNGLFTKLESEVDALLLAVENVDPEFDDGFDVYEEVYKLRVSRDMLYSISSCGAGCYDVLCWYIVCWIQYCMVGCNIM